MNNSHTPIAWIGLKDAIARFECVYCEEVDADPPSERQMTNYLVSGLAYWQPTYVGGRKYSLDTVESAARLLAQPYGSRVLYASPWCYPSQYWLWRRYAVEGVVRLANFAEIRRLTGLERRPTQWLLDKQEIPNAQIGYERFSPVRAVEDWLKHRAPNGSGSDAGEPPAVVPL